MTLARNTLDSISNSNITSNIKISKAEYIATVTECLSDHVECSKHYVDTVTGKYEVLCKCGCHINHIEECDSNK
jgi:hypothetical protein